MSQICTMGKSFAGLLAAMTRTGVKPEIVEWLWLKERTAGLLGWILLLTSRGPAVSQICTIGKTFAGFLAAMTRTGVKLETVEWLWLKERTVGLLGWVLLLTSRGPAVSQICTIGKSFAGFLAATTMTGVKLEIVEWLWLKVVARRWLRAE